MAISYRPPQSSGGGQQPPGGLNNNGFGWFSYRNTLPNQVVNGGEWATISNNGAGQFTETSFAPPGVTEMFNPVNGAILLNQLQTGDQVYIRHTLSITPYINGVNVLFRNLVNPGVSEYSMPFGPPALLDGGAGVPTGLFVVDSHFYIRDQATLTGGLLPQIYGDGTFEMEYQGIYLSVTRRMA